MPMKSNLSELIAATTPDKIRFQQKLADFIVEKRLELVVETGSGITSLLILQAMDKAGFGRLISIDPSPYCGYEVVHPRYELVKKKSFQCLAEIYQRVGPFDLFLHDSDHWFECQQFEYHVGHAMTRQGGWIFADDRTWDNSEVWANFVRDYALDEIILADIAGAQKNAVNVISKESAAKFVADAWEGAKASGKAFRERTGRKPCWTCDDELTEWWKEPDAK